MNAKAITTLAALLLATFGSASARFQAAEFQGPSSSAIKAGVRTIISYMRDRVWVVSERERASYRLYRMPTLTIYVGSDVSNTSKGVIHIAVGHVVRLQALAMIVGHDIMVASGFDTDEPSLQLLSARAAMQVISQTDVADQLFGDEDEFAMLAALSLRCGSAALRCYQAQNAAAICSMFFLVGHEIAHNVLRHDDRVEGAYAIDEEIAADRLATTWLKRYIRSSPDRREVEVSGEARHACLVMPAAFLELSARSAGKGDREWFEQREQAYINSLSGDRSFIAPMVEKQKLSSGLGLLTIRSNQRLKSVVIDTVRLEPRAAVKLLVSAQTHSVVCIGDDGADLKEVIVHRGLETM